MPLGSVLQKTRHTFGVQNLSATADVPASAGRPFVGPLRVYRAGLHVTVAKTTGTAGVITLQSVAGVTETALGTLTTPDTMSAGQTLYKNFEPPLTVAEGAYLKVEITTAANESAGAVFVEFVEDPLRKSYLDGLTALT